MPEEGAERPTPETWRAGRRLSRHFRSDHQWPYRHHRRAARKIVDRLVVGVAINIGKGPLFSLDERVALVQDEIAPSPRDRHRDRGPAFDDAADAFRQRGRAPA